MALPATSSQGEGVAVALLAFGGAAVALDGLGVDRVLVSRIGIADEPTRATLDLIGDWVEALDFGAGRTGSEGAAFLRSFCDEECVGQPEPAWPGHVTHGSAELPQVLHVAMGIFSGPSSNF